MSLKHKGDDRAAAMLTFPGKDGREYLVLKKAKCILPHGRLAAVDVERRDEAGCGHRIGVSHRIG